MNPYRHDSADGQASIEDPEQQILYCLFGFGELFSFQVMVNHATHFVSGANVLLDSQKRLIKELKKAILKGNVCECTAATLTLLRLCKSDSLPN